MRIFHPQTTLHGAERVNSYIVQDEAGMEIGQGWLILSSAREPVMQIRMYMETHPAARDMLFGALSARARYIARSRGPGATRLIGTCSPSDLEQLAYFKNEGFDDSDGEELMQWDLLKPMHPFYAPVGTRVSQTLLQNYADMQSLLVRINRWGGQHHEIEWLMEASEQPYFVVTGVYSANNECIGEMMATGADGEAVLEMLYTVPAWRRHHIATALLLYTKEQLSKRGAVTLRAQAPRSNTPAMGLFQNLHFQWLYTLQIYPSITL